MRFTSLQGNVLRLPTSNLQEVGKTHGLKRLLRLSDAKIFIMKSY